MASYRLSTVQFPSVKEHIEHWVLAEVCQNCISITAVLLYGSCYGTIRCYVLGDSVSDMIVCMNMLHQFRIHDSCFFLALPSHMADVTSK